MPEVFYEDNFVELQEEVLIIKRYFFPMCKPKTVPVRAIRTLFFDEQENGKYTLLRSWGKAPNADIYWAMDLKRCLPGDKCGKFNVIIDIEDGLKKGFTVQDVQTFLQSLRIVANMSLIVCDNLDV